MKVGWIGLGAMGMPMASRLAGDGFSVRGADANPALRIPAGVGIDLVASPTEAVADADAVVVMVATPDQARAVVGAVVEALRPGSVLILTATVGPAVAAELAALVEAAGGLFVDAPVSGGVARAASGDLLTMVGATGEALEAARPVLDAVSSRWPVVGPAAGDGQRMKLVNQLLCGVHIAVAAEALDYAARLGIDPAAALDVLGGGAAASFMLSDRGPRMVAGDFEPPRSAVDIFVKDLGLVVGAVDADLPMASAALARFAAAHDAGMGRLDDAALVRLAAEG